MKNLPHSSVECNCTVQQQSKLTSVTSNGIIAYCLAFHDLKRPSDRPSSCSFDPIRTGQRRADNTNILVPTYSHSSPGGKQSITDGPMHYLIVLSNTAHHSFNLVGIVMDGGHGAK